MRKRIAKGEKRVVLLAGKRFLWVSIYRDNGVVEGLIMYYHSYTLQLTNELNTIAHQGIWDGPANSQEETPTIADQRLHPKYIEIPQEYPRIGTQPGLRKSQDIVLAE